VLNAESIKVLKGEKKVVLKESVKANKINVNNDLFEMLRNLRREIASEESIPPYMVFSDATLKELSIRYPVDSNQMLNISGVGDLKLKKYGEKFLNIIKKYVEENKIEPDWWFKIGTASKTERKSDKPKTHHITINMLKDNMGIREIAKKRQLALSTILTHITKYFEEENVMDINIKFEELFSCLEEKKVLKAIDKVGISKLKPIKDLVPDSIDYDKIRAIIIKNYILKEVAK
jgi:ATP-dependent DNA helicase RecQ